MDGPCCLVGGISPYFAYSPHCAFLRVLKSCGTGGVDIFVFASGLGCYHSLKKSPDTLIFIKKRLIKIVPAYYLCVTPWVIYDGLRLGTTVQGVVATYLGVDKMIFFVTVHTHLNTMLFRCV